MDARVTAFSSRTSSSSGLAWRHAGHFVPLFLLTLGASVLAVERARTGTPEALRLLYGGVVALNVYALATSSWNTVLGAAVTLASRWGLSAAGPLLAPPTGCARTAVILPVFEEDAARAFAVARVVADDVAEPTFGHVDIFVLSDSKSDATISGEIAMHGLAARTSTNGPQLFYRHRACNTGRKAGNIAEFVTRWGAAYDFMIVFDADSLLTGDAIARLIGAMEANPRAGLIQLMCYPVGRRSLFARLQQFNSRLYGELFQRGVAFWQGPRGNFWGHNAILRVSAFAGGCGLPVLPGPPPLGGEILSHDTVEAALMLRAGHDVWMLPDAPPNCPIGSWEATPTNLIDHLVRDRRWCRGNLQHVAVLRADELKMASLYHLSRGLLHYLYAPLVLTWIALYAAVDGSLRPDALVYFVLALSIAPRLLCLCAALADRNLSQGFGGSWKLVAGALLDVAVVALTYPVTLVFHLVFLAETLSKTQARWDASARDDRAVSWREAARCLGAPIGIAIVGVAGLAFVAPGPALWLAPGLLAAIPLAVIGSRHSTGRLIETPEDASSSAIRARVADMEALLRQQPPLSSLAATALPPEAPLPMPAQKLRG